MADPWVALTAIALATERLTIGPLVTPVARRRPHKLARETITLDHLSGGRVVLGVGLGSDNHGEMEDFGEETDPKARAKLLDDGLDRLVEHWRDFAPPPVQQPRIPVWVAARYPNRRPLRRAVKWDGLFPIDLPGPAALAKLRAEMDPRPALRPRRREPAADEPAAVGGRRRDVVPDRASARSRGSPRSRRPSSGTVRDRPAVRRRRRLLRALHAVDGRRRDRGRRAGRDGRRGGRDGAGARPRRDRGRSPAARRHVRDALPAAARGGAAGAPAAHLGHDGRRRSPAPPRPRAPTRT